MLTLPNYQIGRQIYESVNSLVYRGLRKTDNQPVILKMLKLDYPTPAELTRYRQEYDITRLLADVEGVVKAYRLEKHQNTLVIILEDFEAESLKIWQQQRTFSLDELLTFAIRAADILGKIHRQNIIHKDINPSNIVLNPTSGILKIIDLGISTQFKKQHLTLKNPEQLEGTLAYISPEQTGRMNRALDYRTDFYSLGATFYELLTGKVPFESTDALELVHCHIAKTPVPVCQLNSNVPKIISDLVMKLMAKNAENRYQSAFGLKEDLEKCQENLRGFKNIEGFNFELAQNDLSGKFEIPQKLYGRKSETEELLTAFERVAKGMVEIMLVVGYSGIGKSALVKEIYKSLTEKRGYFISGKFDQFQRNIPYTAVVNAFGELVQQLLTENDTQLAQWKDQLLTAIGPNGQVIIEILPEIEWIIGKQPPVPKLGPTESQNRFNLVFQNFIRVFCQPEHPLVIFLDDLQWVDSATLKLLELVMTDQNNTTLFLIGAYRNNEVESTHPLITTLDNFRKEGVTINQITLKPLAFEQINPLIAESLHQNMEAVEPLTNLVMRKTFGNPFFVNQFLHTLYEENLLTFIPPTHSTSEDASLRTDNCSQNPSGWQWDIEQIENLNITDNVVELMIGKLKKLPSSARQVLRLAACIGNHFDLETLSIIYEKTLVETFQDIMPVLTEGFILPSSSLELSGEEIQSSPLAIRHFNFLHDRVQQAAYALIPDTQKQQIHKQIGQIIWQNTHSEELEQNIFAIVDQFNVGLELVKLPAELHQLADLNLMAGKKAKASTAYQSALDYLKTGISLLEQHCWQSDYDLMLALHTEAAEAAFLTGHVEQTLQFIDTILQHSKTLLDQVRAYEIKIQFYTSQNQMLAAVETGLHILKQLGVSLPNKPNKRHMILSLLQTKLILGKKPIKHLADLPEMTQLDKLAAMRILSSTTAAAYLAMPQILPLIVFKQIQLSVKYGNTRISTYSYATYGVILSGALGEIETGYQFGQLALTLLEHFNAKELECKVLYTVHHLINPWIKPVKETLNILPEIYQIGLLTGDLEFASYAITDYASNSYFMGINLPVIKQKIVEQHDLVIRLNQESGLHIHEIYKQVSLNLMGESEQPDYLKSDDYDEAEKYQFYLQTNYDNAIGILYIHKLSLYYHFQNYSKALEAADIAEKYLEAIIGSREISLFNFYDSLNRLAIFPDTVKSEQKRLLKKVATNQKQMKMWAENCPDNYQHKYLLIEAEIARLSGKDWEAMAGYENSIASAKQYGFIQNEALANELAAQFWLAKGQAKFAKTYLKEAHYSYQQWGAVAKVKDLETRYPQFQARKTASAMPTNATLSATLMASNSTQGGSEWLDLNSIMKAAQTLSGEIVLSRLLEKMMHIVIENAGASNGFLLLPQQDNWLIEAEGGMDRDEINLLQSLPLETQNLAKTIIHYVTRTQENVVLNNATQEGQFTRDPYIVKQRPKSVLCVPLLNQGHTTGILYLENNLTTGAFTPKRIELLNLLLSQIAISIENARLYTSITRFLPSEFLSLLNKKNIIEVQLGDQVEKEMSILFSDIRDFTSLSEKMTPQENFDFINCYLGRMEPIISQYQGFIDKYIGDAIMALFPTSADEAVKASIAMLKTLAAYNQERRQSGLEPIAIGIGLNTGLLMLGTVGGENRMDGTVISDAVNLASRIEGMTKMYGAALLISEETYAHLNEVSQYAIRTIDRVKVKGKSEPVTVYEVFDGDAPHLIELKMKTRDDFENGLIYYRQKAFAKAIACFEQVLGTHPDDKAAQIYRGRCQHWLKVGVPDNWEGVEALDRK